MSTAIPLLTPELACKIELSSTLSASEQQAATRLLNLLSATSSDSAQSSAINEDVKTALSSTVSTNKEQIVIKNFVDGRGLACPMPLLKTKVALREVAVGESLYVVATDPNSKADIQAFCEKTMSKPLALANSTAKPLALVINEVTEFAKQALDNENSVINSPQKVDTIFHFIITKTDSN